MATCLTNTQLAAALGLAQLQRLQEFKRKRQQIANYYDHHLNQVSGIELPQFSQFELDSAWFVYVIKIKQQRDAVYACMQQNHIQCGRYFSPVHQQPYWQTTQATMNLPLTEKIASQTLALPFYTTLEEQDVSYICKKLITCCQR